MRWIFLSALYPLCVFGNILEEANASYAKGEAAEHYHERKVAFNEALALYHQVENSASSPPSLYLLPIANTYFQLEEYPWAILYYARALKEDPHDTFALTQIGKGQEKLKIPVNLKEFVPSSIPLLVFWSLCITFVVLSLAIWLPYPWIRKAAICISLFALLLFCYFLFFYYFIPMDGIIVTSTQIYQTPNLNEPAIKTDALKAGTKIQILGIVPKQNWLKIATEKDIGYIPLSAAEPI